MDAVELLKKMREACKTNCYCWLTIDSEDVLLLEWRGNFKESKEGDKKEWALEVMIPPYQMRRPHYLEHSLEDAERKIALLLKGIDEEVQP